MMPTTWLDRICDPTLKDRPSFVHAPRAAKINGAVYTVASDSNRLVFIAADLGYDPTDRKEDKILVDFFEPVEPSLKQAVPLDLLARWASKPVACEDEANHYGGQTCRACRGAGQVACECDVCANKHQAPCEDCGGRGRTDMAVCRGCSFDPTLGVQTTRLGWIADGVLINRRLLDGVLDHITDPYVSVVFAGEFDPVYILGEGVRVLIMPSRHVYGDHDRFSDHDPPAEPQRNGHLLASA